MTTIQLPALLELWKTAAERGQGMWSCKFGSKGGGSFQQLKHHLHPSLSQRQLRQPTWLSRAARPQQLPLLPVPTTAATSDRPHSLPLPGLAVPAWHVVGWGRDAQLVPECTSCSRLPHQAALNKLIWNTCRSAQLQSQLSVCSFCY